MNTDHHRRSARVRETEHRFVVELDVSGFTRSELRVELDGRRIRVDAERGDEAGAAPFSSREALYESFRLPDEADAEHVVVYLDRGLLEIHIPKSAAVARRLPVVGKPHGLRHAQAAARVQRRDHIPVGLGLD